MNDLKPPEDSQSALQTIEKRLDRLTKSVVAMTAVMVLMVFALFITCAAVYGRLVNYFGGDPALYGGSLIGAAVIAFLFGWFARGRR
jgi:hypothetical protein